MGIKKISRKRFLATALAGIAVTKLLPQDMSNSISYPGIKHSIGKTGINVNPVCFGATRTNDESLIKYALDKGINFIDTGRAYGNGNNEILVGKAMTGIREKVVVQSKLRLDFSELPSEGKGKKGAGEIKSVLSSKIEASLKALNTDYIDILLYHDASNESLLFHPAVMNFFSDLKCSGVIKAHGFSTHNGFIILPERNNKECFYDVIMVPFNPSGAYTHSITGVYNEWDQSRLTPILTEAADKGTGIIAMKTCSGGKYSPSVNTKASYYEAVKWVISQPFISSAAVAMANFEQVNEFIPLIQD